MSRFAFPVILLLGTSIAAIAAEAPSPSEIVVTAQRSNDTARSEQRAAANLIVVQAAEDIIKYPDFNAAEALGRMSGVSLSSDTGEGRFVNIRGIDGNLNGTTFGGVVLLNTQPGGTYFGSGGRAVEIDTIPIGAVDRLVVRKTGLPDQEAEGLGGSVELSPRTAQGIKHPFVDGILGGGYQPLRRNGQIFRGELTAGTRFGGTEKPFSVILTGSYHTDRRGIDDVEAAYVDNQPDTPDKAFDSLELRRYNYHRQRFGVGGEVDYDPSPQMHVYARATLAGYTETVNRQRLNYGNLGYDADGNPLGSSLVDPANRNGFVAPFAGVETTLRDEKETHKNFISAIGGRSDLDALTIDYQMSFTSATYTKAFDRNSTFVSSVGSFALPYDNTTDPNYPRITLPNVFNPNDPAQYSLDGFGNSTEHARDHEFGAALNFTLPVHWLSDTDHLKFGGKLRLRNKTDTPVSVSYAPPAIPLTQVIGAGPFTDFYNGTFSVGYAADADKNARFFAANPALFTQSESSRLKDARRNAGAFFDDTENVYAGYGQYDGSIGDLGVLAGVRVEHTAGTYRGIAAVKALDGSVRFAPVARSANYTNAFPTVQLRYAILPNLIARGTWSTGIGRPGFLQLQAGQRVDIGTGTVTTGNPDLKPTTVNAFDASIEYYLPESGILSLGIFDKAFRNYVLSRSSSGTFPGISGIARIASFDNVRTASARGIEASYSQRFVMLPAPFDGLGVTGNLTYVDSKVEIRPGEFSRLPGTSPLTWNLSGYYKDNGVVVRLSASRVGAAIFGVGGSAATDVYQDTRLTLDLATSYDISHALTVYANARNLTNTPLRYYEGTVDRPIQREFYQASYEAGVRFRF